MNRGLTCALTKPVLNGERGNRIASCAHRVRKAEVGRWGASFGCFCGTRLLSFTETYTQYHRVSPGECQSSLFLMELMMSLERC